MQLNDVWTKFDDRFEVQMISYGSIAGENMLKIFQHGVIAIVECNIES